MRDLWLSGGQAVYGESGGRLNITAFTLFGVAIAFFILMWLLKRPRDYHQHCWGRYGEPYAVTKNEKVVVVVNEDAVFMPPILKTVIKPRTHTYQDRECSICGLRERTEVRARASSLS